jgi:hypothetical protein
MRKRLPNRWELLRDMSPLEEGMLHRETPDDPLHEGPMCVGCKGDWPCDFERGRRAVLLAMWQEVVVQ